MTHRLIGSRDTGSALVEMAFALAGLELEVETIPYLEPGPARERLLALNPLGQVPTLVLPDGRVMTESAAIFLHVQDLAPRAGLAPPPDAPERPVFLRWLIFVASAVYPTFTYGDLPDRWTLAGAAAEELRRRSDAARQAAYGQMEAAAGAPWFLGERFSAIDLYVVMLTRWRPRRPWFDAHAPRLAAIADRAAALPAVAPVLARHRDGPEG
jgi:GST-like protein